MIKLIKNVLALVLIAGVSSALGQQISGGGGGGGGTPGGSNTQVQYNNSSAFGGSAAFTFDGTDINTTGQFHSSKVSTNGGVTFSSGEYVELQSASDQGSYSAFQVKVQGAVAARFSSGGTPSGYAFASDYGSGVLGFTTNPSNVAIDIGIARNAANVLEVNSGTAAAYRELKLRSLVIGGTVPGISGCSAGTQAGGATAGTFVLGAASCSVTLTFAFTAPTGWSCYTNDRTTAAAAGLVHQTASTTTTAVIAVPVTAVVSDVVDFHCVAY